MFNVHSRAIGSVLTLALAATGCGAEADVEHYDVGSVEQANQSRFDSPVSASVVLSAIGAEMLYCIDSSGILRFKPILLSDPTPGTDGWVTMTAPTFLGIPAVMSITSGTTPALDLYAVRSDGHLLEFYFENAIDLAPDIYDISAIVGISGLSGSPEIVQWDNDTADIAVAVRRASDNRLYIFEWTSSTDWVVSSVKNGSTPIKTGNTLHGAYGRIWGRGLSATDDSTSWIALRSPSSYTTDYDIVTTFDDSSGTPDLTMHADGTGTAYARFGNVINYAPLNNNATIGGWTSVPNLTVAGSPLKNLVRGSNGSIWSFDTNRRNDLGVQTTSAVQQGRNGGSPYGYYRCSNGHLCAMQRTAGSPNWDLGIVIP